MAPPPRVSPFGRPVASARATVQNWPLQLSCMRLGTMDWTSAVRVGWQMEACATQLSPLESAVVVVNPGSEQSIATATRRASLRATLATMSTASKVRATIVFQTLCHRWHHRALLNLLNAPG